MAYTSDLENTLDALQKELDSYSYLAAEEVTIQGLREAYAEEMINQDKPEHAKDVLAKDLTVPVFTPPNFNGEDEPIKKEMQIIPTDVALDLACIDNKIISIAEDYAVLISNTISRLNAVKNRLFECQQKIKDINFISSTYNNLNGVIRLSRNDFTGTFDTIGNDRTFCAYTPTVNSQVSLKVDSIVGNGYLGNRYVLRQDQSTGFAEQILDTKDFTHLTDNNSITAVEYSRLCAVGATNSNNPDINKDSQDVVCTIKLSSDTLFNTLLLDTNSQHLVIKDVLVSTDDTIYRSMFSQGKEITTSEYTKCNYIANSNIISFPSTKHVQLILSSHFNYATENLAEEKTVVNSVTGKPKTTIQLLENVIRKVISLNSIDGFYAERQDDSIMQSYQLIPDNRQYNRIAIFANEYIPENFSQNIDYIQYTLYVNGEAYPVEPINSDKPGTKMLSFTDYNYDNENIVYLNEPIRTAQVVINIKTHDAYSTPYVGNIKLCLG